MYLILGGGKAVKLVDEVALPILKEKGIEVEVFASFSSLIEGFQNAACRTWR